VRVHYADISYRDFFNMVRIIPAMLKVSRYDVRILYLHKRLLVLKKLTHI